jgi:hypothetical protein
VILASKDESATIVRRETVPNLLDSYLAVLLLAFMRVGLFDGILQVCVVCVCVCVCVCVSAHFFPRNLQLIRDTEDKFVSVRATVLLGELLDLGKTNTHTPTPTPTPPSLLLTFLAPPPTGKSVLPTSFSLELQALPSLLGDVTTADCMNVRARMLLASRLATCFSFYTVLHVTHPPHRSSAT